MKKLTRTRPNDPKYIQKQRTQRLEKSKKLVNECEKIMPIIEDEYWKEISDPAIAICLIDPTPSPEAELIDKDFFTILSDEARDLAKVILSCPEEFFERNGKIKKRHLYNECKKKLGWSPRKSERSFFEMQFLLQYKTK